MYFIYCLFFLNLFDALFMRKIIFNVEYKRKNSNNKIFKLYHMRLNAKYIRKIMIIINNK